MPNSASDTPEPPEPGTGEGTTNGSSEAASRRFHRLHEVCQLNGTPLQTLATLMQLDLDTAREQANPTNDLRLSQLLKWQVALDVPLADLLEDTGFSLKSRLVDRETLTQLKRVAVAIQFKAESVGTRRLADMLIDQLEQMRLENKEATPQ